MQAALSTKTIPWAAGTRQIVHEWNYRGISVVLEQSEQREQSIGPAYDYMALGIVNKLIEDYKVLTSIFICLYFMSLTCMQFLPL